SVAAHRSVDRQTGPSEQSVLRSASFDHEPNGRTGGIQLQETKEVDQNRLCAFEKILVAYESNARPEGRGPECVTSLYRFRPRSNLLSTVRGNPTTCGRESVHRERDVATVAND